MAHGPPSSTNFYRSVSLGAHCDKRKEKDRPFVGVSSRRRSPMMTYAGRIVIPVDFALRSDRAYYFVCPKNRNEHSYVGAVFRLAGSPPIMEASHGNSGTRLPGYWNNQD